MAGRVIEYTGINPITVDQTKYDSHLEINFAQLLSQRLESDEPTVFFDLNNLSFEGESDTSWSDIMVFHEQNVYEHSRPIWLFGNNKIWVEMDLTPIQLDCLYFLFAFNNGENITAVIPVDLLEITDSLKTVHFVLNKGNYKAVD
ncbi:MAG: hypothetical protein QMC40_06820 [Vicingaceae bacterium]|jgi:hypothetical protein